MEKTYIAGKHLRFVIVHHAVFNICSGSSATTWNYEDKLFVWDIDRPEKGTKRFQRTCQYCGKSLEIDVDSFDTVNSENQRIKRNVTIGKYLAPVFIIACIVLIWLGSRHNWLYFYTIFCMFGFFYSLAAITCKFSSGYHTTGLMAELQLEPGRGAYDSHYVEEVNYS